MFFTGFPLFPGGNRSRLIKKHLGLKMTYEFDCEFVRVFPWLRTTLWFRKRKKHSSWACLRPPKNVNLGFFTSQSCSDGKDMYKKAPRTCKVIVLLYKPTTCLVTFSLPSLMFQIPKAPCCHYWHNKINNNKAEVNMGFQSSLRRCLTAFPVSGLKTERKQATTNFCSSF